IRWLDDEAKHETGTGRAAGLSSGAALVLIGLGRRSLVGAILGAVGGRLAYQAVRGRPTHRPEPDGSSQGHQDGASALYASKRVEYKDALSPALANSRSAESS